VSATASMQPRYPYKHRAVVMRLDDDSLFILSQSSSSDIRADIAALGCKIDFTKITYITYMGDWSRSVPAQGFMRHQLALKRKDLTFYKLVYRHT